MFTHQNNSTALKNDKIILRLFKMHFLNFTIIIFFLNVHLSVFRNSGVTFEDLNKYKKLIELNS